MKQFLRQLHMIRHWVVLKRARKEKIRNMLLARMARRSSVATKEESFFWNITSYFSLKPVQLIAFFIVLSLVGGGTSFAAEGTLPGDPLYPIKIHVNEEVVAALSLSSRAKADWETTRAERRLKEAAALAAENKLDADTENVLKTSFKTHSERTKQYINRMEENGDIDEAVLTASRLESSLDPYEITEIDSDVFAKDDENENEDEDEDDKEDITRTASDTLRDIRKTRKALEEKREERKNKNGEKNEDRRDEKEGERND